MFLTICGDIKKFKIINYKINYKNGFIYEKVQIQLFKKNLDLVFNFSNFPGDKNRNIKIVGQKGYLKFNSYLKKDNYIFYKKKEYIRSKTSSIENILDLFLNNVYKKSMNSNIIMGVKEHFLSTTIIKKISLIRRNAFKSQK